MIGARIAKGPRTGQPQSGRVGPPLPPPRRPLRPVLSHLWLLIVCWPSTLRLGPWLLLNAVLLGIVGYLLLAPPARLGNEAQATDERETEDGRVERGQERGTEEKRDRDEAKKDKADRKAGRGSEEDRSDRSKGRYDRHKERERDAREDRR